MSKRRKKNISSKKTLYVQGMHCASCEVLIEKKLLKLEGVQSVDASLNTATVDISYKGAHGLSKEYLNKEFKELGYTFSTRQKKPASQALLTYHGDRLEVHPDAFGRVFKNIGIAAILIIIFMFFERMQIGKYIQINESSSIVAFFVLGLVASISSCAALIGGLLLSMVKQWNETFIDSDSMYQKAQPHMLFHIGRLVSFFVFGGMLGMIGSMFTTDNIYIYSIFILGISAIMFVLALQMLDVSWAQRFRIALPKFVGRFAVDSTRNQGRITPFVIGVLTFFLPCGFTLVVQGIAASSGSFFRGALVMMFFALGTLPVLSGISVGGVALNKKPHVTAIFNKVAGFIIIFFVLYNINSQLNVLGLPSLSDINKLTSNNSVAVLHTNIDSQQLAFIAKGFEYIPTSATTIQSGVPTTLTIDNQGIAGCGAYVAARGLFDGYIVLKDGINAKDIGKPNPGTYKLTCTMGMVPPVTIKVL